ncbi:MAG: 50S ribosomal protein L22 [Croceimicrobium sp.]|nr:50S ribosomal protein L22 [Bacteroidota bacterium]
MGSRKKQAAEVRKEARKTVASAQLRNYPTSPRKMRLVADMVRGMDVEKALFLLKHSPKHASIPMEKLLLSAINNWEQKNEGERIEDAGLFVESVQVDSARMLKRIQPAPQGRAHRIRKRSNHVTIVVNARQGAEVAAESNEISE